LLPIWIYIMMLPYSLGIFGNFSLYHPLSILWTSLFVIFYPLSLFLHIIGVGEILDFALLFLIELETNATVVTLAKPWLALQIALSLFAIFSRALLSILLFYCISIFIYFMYDIA